jgi:hypothetical protein
VPQRDSVDPPLGKWVQTQRAVFKSDDMDPERKAKLNEIAFDFNIWDFQFQKLHAFKENHGHCELLWAVDCLTFILNTPH